MKRAENVCNKNISLQTVWKGQHSVVALQNSCVFWARTLTTPGPGPQVSSWPTAHLVVVRLLGDRSLQQFGVFALGVFPSVLYAVAPSETGTGESFLPAAMGVLRRLHVSNSRGL